MVRLLALLAVAGCTTSNTIDCDGGYLCPAGKQCDELHKACVFPDQLTACGGNQTGDCMFGEVDHGTCVDGVCFEAGCGDHVAMGLEECDDQDLRGADCTSLGYYTPGAVTCKSDCTFDVSACGSFCGDHEVNAPMEQCDAEVGAVVSDCLTAGFYEPGEVTCNRACRYNTLGCHGTCGDHTVDPQETCEPELGPRSGETCLTYGFDLGSITCAATCTTGTDRCERYDFVTEALPTTQQMVALAALGAGQFIAVGENGNSVLHTTGTWVEGVPIGMNALHGAWASGPRDAFAVGDMGTIQRFDGTTWTMMTSNTTRDLRAVWGRSANDVYAAGADAIVHWNGTAWTETIVAGVTILDLRGAGPDVFALADDRVLHQSATGWDNIGGPSSRANGHLAVARGVAYVGADTLYRYTIATETWDTIPTTLTVIDAIWASRPDRIVVAGAIETQFLGGSRTPKLQEWDGARWWDLRDPPDPVFDIEGSDDDLEMIAGHVMMHADTTRIVDDAVPRPPLIDVWIESGIHKPGFGVGAGGAILYIYGFTTARSSAWMTSPTTSDLYGVWGRAADDVFAVGTVGAIIHWDGTAWTEMTSGTTAPLIAVVGDATTTYAIGNGVVLQRGLTGAWTPIAGAPANATHAVLAGSNLFVSTATGIERYDGSWTHVSSTPQIRGMCVRNGQGIAVGDGFMLREDKGWMSDPAVFSSFNACNGSIAVGEYGALGHINNAGIAPTPDTTGILDSFLTIDPTGSFAISPKAIIELGVATPTDPPWHRAYHPSFTPSVIWGDGSGRLLARANDGHAGANAALVYDGARWTAIPMTGGFLDPMWGTSFTNAYGVKAGQLYRFDGTTWSPHGPVFTVDHVWGTSPTTLVGIDNAAGTVAFFDGTSWSAPAFVAADLSTVWASSATDVYVANNAGELYHFDGSTWTFDSNLGSVSNPIVFGTAPNDVFVAGGSGLIQHWNGANWETQPTGTLEDFRSIAGTGPSDIWARARLDTIVHYDGLAWSPVRFPTSYAIDAIWADPHRVTISQHTDTGFMHALLRPGFGHFDPRRVLSCGETITATNLAGDGDVARYSCGTRDELGAATYYEIARPTNGTITATITSVDNEDFDVIFVDAASLACVASGDTMAMITATANARYVIAVDSPKQTAGAYRLSITCQ